MQLADHSIRYLRGILEDVLVQMNDLILPADFLILEIEEASIPAMDLPTACTKIDVQTGTLTKKVQGEP